MTTWDPARKGASLAVYNNNLEVSTTPGVIGSGGQTVFSTVTKSSGKLIFEVLGIQLTSNWTVGVGNNAFPTTGDYLGDEANGFGFYPINPKQAGFINNSQILGGGNTASSNNEIFTFCFDITNKLIWCSSPTMRGTTGAWNNSNTANPATGVGGVSISFNGPYYILFNSDQDGGIARLNTGQSAFSLAIPSGFQPWDGSASVNVSLVGASSQVIAGLIALSSPGSAEFTNEFTNEFTTLSPFNLAGASSAVNAGIITVQSSTPPSTNFITGVASAVSAGVITVQGSTSSSRNVQMTGASVVVSATAPNALVSVIGDPITSQDAIFFCAEIETYRPGDPTSQYSYGHGSHPHAAIDLFAHVPITSGILRSSDIGYRSREIDAAGLNVYPPTLTSAFQIDRAINVDPTAAQSGVSSGWGKIKIANPNGDLDTVSRNWNADGRAVRIYWGRKLRDHTRQYLVDPPFSTLQLAFAGTAQPWTLAEDGLTVPLRDASYAMERPIQKRQYLGTGGYEGNASLSGTDRPMLRGGSLPTGSPAVALPVKNITPVLLDPVKQIYAYTDGSGYLATVWEGASSTFTRASDTNDLFSGTCPPGQFRTDNSRGLFQLGTLPSAAITVDAYGYFPVAGYKDTLFQIARYLLTEELGINENYLDLASFTRADVTYNYKAGVFFTPNSGIDGVAAVDRMLAGVGARLVPMRNGKLTVVVLRAVPLGAVVKGRFDTTNVVTINPIQLPPQVDPPPYRYRVAYQHNHTVQTTGILGSASDDQKQFVAVPDRFATWISNNLQVNYLRPNDPSPIVGPLLTKGDAQAVANDLGALWGVQQRAFQVIAPAQLALQFELGDYVTLTYPISDLVNGQLGQIVSETLDSGSSTVTYTVIGVQTQRGVTPGKVPNLIVVRSSDNTVDLRWDVPSGSNLTYQIMYRPVTQN